MSSESPLPLPAGRPFPSTVTPDTVPPDTLRAALPQVPVPALSQSAVDGSAGSPQETPHARADLLAEQIFAHLSHQGIDRQLPQATYRLQFNGSFTFQHARQIVPYLARLGISHVYASPLLKAVSGSQHGYDIVDFGQLNPELGSPADFEQFVQTLQSAGLQLVLDVVPNHMGIASSDNQWWNDVLENGPSSPYASFFDIDWAPLKPDLANKVLLPVLGDQFGRVLEDQQLRLEYDEGAFFVSYFNRRFPIGPRAAISILTHRLDVLEQQFDPESPQLLELHSILTALNHLPERTETDADKINERRREKEVIKRRLNDLCHSTPEILGFVLENVRIFNGVPGDPRSFDLLEQLLENQAYRLAHWRVAADEINYRRFFDINDLAAISMEHLEVFQATHRLILQWIAAGKATGLRIDHADGLYNPAEYLDRLQRTRFLQLCRAAAQALPDVAAQIRDGVPNPADAAPVPLPPAPPAPPSITPNNFAPNNFAQLSPPSGGAAEVAPNGEDAQLPPWSLVEARLLQRFGDLSQSDPQAPLATPLYVVIEKILGSNEPLPAWPAFGTTGYEYLNTLNGVFIAPENARSFDNIYARFVRKQFQFRDLVYQSKKLILDASMSSELAVLGFQLDRISEQDRWSRDFTLNGETNAIREIIACFPVYRTYIDGTGVLDRDRRYTEAAVARARAYNPAISASIFNFVRDILLLKSPEGFSDSARAAQLKFVGRFQQTTSPVMAKGFEDTAFYIYNRLISLNDVGGNPERFGIPVHSFHADNQERQRQRPYTLLATSTHDTKRSEDVRARINVLSELPREWKAHVFRWARLNQRRKTKLDGDVAPSRNDEYLLYQTLIGSWPFEPMSPAECAAYTDRIQQYALKAVREAKVHTSWVNPNEAYEQALREFVAAMLDPSPRNLFITEFAPFAAKVAEFGIWNSLSQLVLKLTSPGVPDLFQGTELWNLSLVDPDNRRPVDFARRQALLDQLLAEPAGRDRLQLSRELLETRTDGRIKLYTTARLLQFRQNHPELCRTGSYLPLETHGPQREHLVAFARGDQQGPSLLVVVPRLVAQLTSGQLRLPLGPDIWHDTSIHLPASTPPAIWQDLFTGQIIDRTAGGFGFPAAELFATWPVAVLARTES